MIDLNQFVEWVNEKPRKRNARINVGCYSHNLFATEGIEVWVVDADINEGQHVKSVDEINLEGEKVKKEKKELERLLVKYGNVSKTEETNDIAT